MKVQTKITLLLLAVVTIFMAGLWAFRAFDQQKFRQIRMNRLVEAKRARLNGRPLITSDARDLVRFPDSRHVADLIASGVQR